MRALPDDGWNARGDGDGVPPFAGVWRVAGVARHGFTHFDLDLQLMLCDHGEMGHLMPRADGGEFWPIDKIEDAGLPTVFAKAARIAIAGR